MAETSGLVQQLTWDPAGRTVFVYIGPAQTAVRVFRILFISDNGNELAFSRSAAQFLGKARSAGLAVTVQYDDHLNATGVQTRVSRIRVDAIEVTQSIRTSSTPSRSWPSSRRSYAYISSSRANPPVTVRGQIGVRRGDGPLVMIESLNNVLVDATQSGQIAAQRNDVQRSINFLLPSDQLAAGSLTVDLLSLVDVATNSSVDPGPHSPVTLNFYAGAPLRLRVLGIRYEQGTPPQVHIPSVIDFGLVNSWLLRAYPVHQVLSSQAIVAATQAPPFTCDQINSELLRFARSILAAAQTSARTTTGWSPTAVSSCAVAPPYLDRPIPPRSDPARRGLIRGAGTSMAPTAIGTPVTSWATRSDASIQVLAPANTPTTRRIHFPLDSFRTPTMHSWISTSAIPSTACQ